VDLREIVFIADANRNVIFMCKEGRSFFELNGNLETYKYDFLNLFHPKSKEVIKENIHKAVHAQLSETRQLETKTYLSESTIVRLKFKFQYSKTHKLENYIGVIQVNDDSGNSERNKLYNLPGFIQNLPLGIYRTSPDGEVILVNTGFLKIFGFESEEDLRNTELIELFVEKSLRAELIKKCIESEECSFEFQAFKKDKTIIWVRDTFRAVFDKDKQILYLDGIIEDITQKKINEQLLLESETKLKESNLSKDRFFSIISHDLRSPFNQIIGATELLISKIDEYDKRMIKKFLILLNEEAVQSFRLLENLLQWSKNQRGLIQFEPKPLFVEKLLKEVMSVLEQIAGKKEISFEFIFPADMHIYADKEMLSTILRNLISNAIKFTSQKGKIIVSASEKMDYTIQQSYVEFCVADNGIGIPENDLLKLFNLTESYNSKGTYNESGTGLGLLLCKEFVEQHNGRIWAESTPGVGSQFKFTLPY